MDPFNKKHDIKAGGKREMMDCTKVYEKLFVGSCPIDASDIAMLKSSGVTHVLNLQSDADMRKYGINWSSLEAAYSKHNICVTRIPMGDFNRNDIKAHLPEALDVLERLIADNTVYVHCSAGINRSPTVVLGYMVLKQGVPLEKAFELLTKKRACDPYLDCLTLT